MRVLLDTHALIWWVVSDPRLSRKAREIIDDISEPRHISAVTGFEIANKVRIGKLAAAAEIADNLEAIISDNGFGALPITVAHGLEAGRLPSFHRDPFDRLLAAQSLIENIPLVTNDPAFREFGVNVVW